MVEAKNLRKSFGERMLVEDLNFTLPPGGIIGVVVPNGAGKTSLLRMIAGAETPDAGELRIGETVQVSYVDQSRDSLNGDSTVWQEVSGGLDLIEIEGFQLQSRAYVGRFNFKGTEQEKRVANLSGGERNRVHLAKLLVSGGNLLLLDEPTNDLDVETLQALEQALLDFPGCVVVVSHDRWFLNRIATHILAFEGDSQAVWFQGTFDDYEEDRRQRTGGDVDQPQRIKYKRINA